MSAQTKRARQQSMAAEAAQDAPETTVDVAPVTEPEAVDLVDLAVTEPGSLLEPSQPAPLGVVDAFCVEHNGRLARYQSRETLTDMLESALTTISELRAQLAERPAPRQTRSRSTGGHIDEGRLMEPGTVLTATYKGTRHTLTVVNENDQIRYRLDDEEKLYKSPSSAGSAVTGGNVNGWRFWRTAGGDQTRETDDGDLTGAPVDEPQEPDESVN